MMVTMGVKMFWTLALFVFSCSSQSQVAFTREKITRLYLGDVQKSGSTVAGRVVIQINNEGVDGAICGTWTRGEAVTACRMLGYNDGNNIPLNAAFLHDNHNFLISNLRCTGHETSLSDCLRDPIVNCPYDTHNVVVSCSSPGPNPVDAYTSGFAVLANRVTPAPLASHTDIADYTNCPTPNQNIRLRGVIGRPGMGYVQVNVNGDWQYICDDKWSENDAKVVCRELCYNEPTCARPGVENEYKPALGQSPVFAWNRVQCTGIENTLDACTKDSTTPQGQCGPYEMAGVQCVVPFEASAAMNAQLECGNLNGDPVLHFPRDNFPTINGNSLRLANAPAGCTARAQRDQQTGSYNLRIPTQGCGTTKSDNGSLICYSNTVEYDNEVYTGNVLLDYKKKTFSVSCCMPTEKDVSIKFIPKTQEYAQSMSQYFDYTPEISFYQNERCDIKITQDPYAVEVGDWVYIGVSVKAEDQSLFRDSDLKLVVTRCTANPIKGVPDSTFPENVTLIDNKCPADIASVTTYPISNTTEGFRFRAFKFFGYSSIYVTCHLRVCLSTDTKPLCDRSCAQNNIGRKRRNVAEEVTGLDTVVSQILQITDPKQPPVKALPAQSHEDRPVESINPRFLKP
ncbi:unnamed protein product [Lymnaea stagnalis]|uniref:Deleted in malignant brain tumors 1 protein-like n=1 Tax=Lymnaea stagnalis TaxID=6523 RepID=A0AAV2HHQ5_LYMST